MTSVAILAQGRCSDLLSARFALVAEIIRHADYRFQVLVSEIIRHADYRFQVLGFADTKIQLNAGQMPPR